MLFNGKFVFWQYPMLFNGYLGLENLRGDVRTYGRTDIRTDGRLEIHPCVLQDIGPLHCAANLFFSTHEAFFKVIHCIEIKQSNKQTFDESSTYMHRISYKMFP